jgi:hypothetical protein
LTIRTCERMGAEALWTIEQNHAIERVLPQLVAVLTEASSLLISS